ncbi:Alpha/Beta hydrolase protein [Cyathus striatus]|nr:Alpha/Beta hydrolase protein [Cyathus striatus]
MSTDSSFITLSTGISLEVDLVSPQSSLTQLQNGGQLAVCLHPWSWLGGQKNDPVLLSLEKPLLAHGYHVLRYNSRGVGRSSGSASLTGFAEGQDLEEIVQWAQNRISNVHTVFIIGYSYGSLITSLHPVLPAPIKTFHVLLSYPLGPRGMLTLFRSATYQEKLTQLICSENANVLIIFGDHDEFTSASKYREWGRSLEDLSGKGNMKVVEVVGATHFWRGEAGYELGKTVGEWLR